MTRWADLPLAVIASACITIASAGCARQVASPTSTPGEPRSSPSPTPTTAATTQAPDGTPTPRPNDLTTQKFPDNSVDVCVWTYDGAQANTKLIAEALDAVEGTVVGQNVGFGADRGGPRYHRVHLDCAHRPAVLPVKPNVKKPGGWWFMPDEYPRQQQRIPEDLFLFIVPQDVADDVPGTWSERVSGYGDLQFGHGGAALTRAALLGDGEATDFDLLVRTLVVGFLIGGNTELRPNLDGECIEPTNPQCGPPLGY